MSRFFTLIFLFLVASCNNLEFVYEDNKGVTNPLYERSEVAVSGLELRFIKSYIPTFFGETRDPEYDLLIEINEKKIKSSIEINQAVSSLSYELRFVYLLKSIKLNCLVYSKEILSTFTINPKSSGYNFGTDVSLEKKYELAIKENLDRFISNVSSIDINNCK